MPDSYQIADAWDNEAGLAALDPQPQCEGLKDSVVGDSISGAAYADGVQFLELNYSSITPAQWAALLTQTGTAAAYYNHVTMRANIGGDRLTFANFNAIIKRPRNPKYRLGFYRDLTFTVQLWEAL